MTDEGIKCIVRSILTPIAAPFSLPLRGGYDLKELEESIAVTIAEMLRYWKSHVPQPYSSLSGLHADNMIIFYKEKFSR